MPLQQASDLSTLSKIHRLGYISSSLPTHLSMYVRSPTIPTKEYVCTYDICSSPISISHTDDLGNNSHLFGFVVFFCRSYRNFSREGSISGGGFKCLTLMSSSALTVGFGTVKLVCRPQLEIGHDPIGALEGTAARCQTYPNVFPRSGSQIVSMHEEVS